MVIKRIVFSFILMAVLCAAIAALGVFSAMNSNQALQDVIDDDLPAADALGAVGRNVMAVQANLNALLNANLSLDERLGRHRGYERAQADLSVAVDSFNNFIKRNSGQAEMTQVTGDWNRLSAVARDWLSVSDEIIAKFKQWEDSKVLNTTELLMNLEKYRGDHYFLVRRISEMETKKQAIGPVISPDDTLCAFGRWRKQFEGGADLLAQNSRFQEAMRAMSGPHKDFHAGAAETYRLIQENPDYNNSRIQSAYLKLLTDADQVVGTFGAMIEEAGRAQNIYQEASDLSAGRLAALRDGTLTALDELLTHKLQF